MKALGRIVLMLMATGLSGCYTASLMEMDILKPADITFPGNVRSLVVVARCDLDSAYKATLLKERQLSRFERDSTMSKQVVLGCSDAILESPRFTINNPVIDRTLGPEFSGASHKIPWDQVVKIAGDPPVDAVLSLEDVLVDDTLKSSVANGWLTYTYQVYVKTFWRFYRIFDFQSKEFNFSDTVSFDIDEVADFMSSSNNRVQLIRDALYDSGARTARRMAPWWSVTNRYYYPFGSGDFVTGAEYLRKGQGAEAAEVFRPLTASKRMMVAAKASFNMALGCELAGNIPAALEWLKKAEDLGIPGYYIMAYRQQLTARLRDSNSLDQQMK
jgi:hypothetical protein